MTVKFPNQIAKTTLDDFIISTIWIEEINRYETMVFTKRSDGHIGDELESHRNEHRASAMFIHAMLMYEYTEGAKKK